MQIKIMYHMFFSNYSKICIRLCYFCLISKKIDTNNHDYIKLLFNNWIDRTYIFI